MADAAMVWTVIGPVLGAASGVIAKSMWDRRIGWKSNLPIETWKIQVKQLERRLSEFYWPLYHCLMRDDVVWPLVFMHLKPTDGRPQPDWITRLSPDERRKISHELETKSLLANHVDAINIIRSGIHLANADEELLNIIGKYIRHVDAYTSLRSAGMTDIDPIDVGEPYPKGLTEAIKSRLDRYQTEYDNLLKNKGIVDLRD